MRIEDGKMVLRDFSKDDIEDEVRWLKGESDWMLLDTPWDPVCEDDPATIRSDMQIFAMMAGRTPSSTVRPRLEIEWEGRHVGFCSSYFLESDYSDTVYDPFQKPEGKKQAIGIAICEKDARGKGIGTKALRMFEKYLERMGRSEACMETWPGNTAMLHVAEKLGYETVLTDRGYHENGGRTWDRVVLSKRLS